MTITIPDDLLAATRLTEQEILQELAVLLFVKDKFTLAQAASLCGSDRMHFQHLPASRDIPVHYGVQEFEADLAALQRRVRSSPEDFKAWDDFMEWKACAESLRAPEAEIREVKRGHSRVA